MTDQAHQPDELEAKHGDDCPLGLAIRAACGIECEHGYDACPICDPCTCAAPEQCGQCGEVILGGHGCQGVPGGFGEDE